jgi:hypothetical protein
MSQQTVIATFDTRAQAEHALSQLVASGFGTEKISMLMSEPARIRELGAVGPTPAEGAGVGGMLGGVLGALAGGLVAVGSLVLPGIGLLAVGPLVAAFAGAGAGGAAGTMIGGLVSFGLCESEATATHDAIGKGKILVAAHVAPEDAARAVAVLTADGGASVHAQPA